MESADWLAGGVIGAESLEQGFSNFFPGDPNFSIKNLRDPKQTKMLTKATQVCINSPTFGAACCGLTFGEEST